MRSTGNATNPIESTNAQPQWVREQGGSESKPSVVEYFRSKEVVEILGVTRRQLQYWAQTDLVRPSQLPLGNLRGLLGRSIELPGTRAPGCHLPVYWKGGRRRFPRRVRCGGATNPAARLDTRPRVVRDS